MRGPKPPAQPDRGDRQHASIRLLDAFEMSSGGLVVQVPHNVQRVLAFVALRDRPVHRSYVAGRLWPETTEQRSTANLRSALWRLGRERPGLIDETDHRLRLDTSVEVDLRRAVALAARVIRGGDAEPDGRRLLARDLLPDWDEDWLDAERERFRQLRLHALDVLGERLLDAGRAAESIEVGLVSVAAEPLRESARRVVVRAHLAEGNVSEAVRQFRAYRELLRAELGADPSGQMLELVRDYVQAGGSVPSSRNAR